MKVIWWLLIAGTLWWAATQKTNKVMGVYTHGKYVEAIDTLTSR